MADSTLAASTSRRYAPVPDSLISLKIIQAYQTLAQAESPDLGGMCAVLPAIEDYIGLPLDGWQDSSSPVLNFQEPKLASHAVMVANHFDSCLGKHLPSL